MERTALSGNATVADMLFIRRVLDFGSVVDPKALSGRISRKAE
jgi:hypothetical protein